jgi:hypothetical protein
VQKEDGKDNTLSNFAFKFNLHRLIEARAAI